MSGQVKSASDRREFRFVKALNATKGGVRSTGGICRIERNGKAYSHGVHRLLALAQSGVIDFKEECFKANANTSNWLRRQLATADSFAAQHRDVAIDVDGTQRNKLVDPLLKLGPCKGGSKYLSSHHIEAARRVCVWAERARLVPHTTMSYGEIRAGGGKDGGAHGVSEMAAQARRSLAHIYKLIPHDCAEVVMDVCVYEKGLQSIEKERQWPRRSAKLILRIALEQLAQAYSLSSTACGMPSAGAHWWQEPGMRPT